MIDDNVLKGMQLNRQDVEDAFNLMLPLLESVLNGDNFIMLHEKYLKSNKFVNAETAFFALVGTIQMYLPSARLPYSSYDSFRAAKSAKKRRKRAKSVNNTNLEIGTS